MWHIMPVVGARTQHLLLTALTSCALAACKADHPKLGGDGDGVDAMTGDACTPFADRLVAFTPAGGESSDLGDNALRAPDAMVVPVATNDILTVGFFGRGGVVDREEIGVPELQVHLADGSVGQAGIYLSVQGDEYETAGTIDGTQTQIDLSNTATIEWAFYLQVIGTSGELAIDAFEVLTDEEGECPASVR